MTAFGLIDKFHDPKWKKRMADFAALEKEKGSLKEAILEMGKRYPYPEFNMEFWLLIEERGMKGAIEEIMRRHPERFKRKHNPRVVAA